MGFVHPIKQDILAGHLEYEWFNVKYARFILVGAQFEHTELIDEINYYNEAYVNS